jgi:hypothetical protein
LSVTWIQLPSQIEATLVLVSIFTVRRVPFKWEVVCEVVEGDISQLSVQFIDKLGNVVEGYTQTPVIHRELPKEV